MFNNCTTGFTMPVAPVAYGTGYSNGNGMFGGDGLWGLIIILALLGGFGNGGFGGFGGFGGNRNVVEPCATQADVRAAVDQQTLISKLDNQTYGLADSTYALNNSIMSGFHGVDNAICTLGYQNQQGFNTLGYQMKDCCCETQRLLERGFADTNYNLATQTCDLKTQLASSTRDIVDANNANTRAILDFMNNTKISELQTKLAQAEGQLSQANQTNNIISALRPCPSPAYVVPNPYAYCNPCGGCGC